MGNTICEDGEQKFIIKLVDIDCGYKIFNILAKNEMLTCRHDFWFSYDDIEIFKKDLNKIYVHMTNEVKISDTLSDAFLKFTFVDNFGHIKINGQLGSSKSEDYAVFSIYSDQTIFPLLIEKMESEIIEL